VADFVLRKPPAAEREAIEGSIDRSMEALDTLLAGDMTKATMTLHAGPQRPKPPRPPKPPTAADPA
jgi:PTH1 family peptidyl-tRNA hydrolase